MDLISWFETQARLFPGIVWIDLMHMRSSGLTRVTRFVMPDKDRSAIVSLILTSAHAAGQAFRGPQTFVIFLLEEHGTEPVCQHPLLVQEQARADELTATSEGVLKQVMQQNAMLMKRVNENTEQSYQSHRILADENERLRTRCDAVENKHLQVIALQEEMMSLRHERDLTSMRTVAAEKRKDHLVSSVTAMVPAVLPTVAHKVLGTPEPTKDPALGAFFRTITQEQFASLHTVLRPEQLAALGHLFQKHTAPADAPKQPPTPHEPKKNPSDMN